VCVVKILISHICIKTVIIKINEYRVNGRLIYRIKKSIYKYIKYKKYRGINVQSLFNYNKLIVFFLNRICYIKYDKKDRTNVLRSHNRKTIQ